MPLKVVNMVLLDLGMVERPLSMASGIGPVLVALVHVLVPLMVLSIAGALQGIDRRLEESARILGAGRIGTLARGTVRNLRRRRRRDPGPNPK